MKAKNFKLLPILAFVPLCMANSPVIRPSTANYDDIDISYTFIERVNDSLIYDMTITNKGDSFALLYGHLRSVNPYKNYGGIRGDVFTDECLAPHQTKTFKFLTDDPIEDFIRDDTTWSTDCYDILDENVSWSNPFIEQDTYYYTLKADFKNIGDYHYSTIVELLYEGDVYYVDAPCNNRKYLRLNMEKDINPNDIEVRNITFFKSSRETYKGGKTIAIVFYVFFGLILFGILLIPPAIIIPISIVSHKRKQRNNISK